MVEKSNQKKDLSSIQDDKQIKKNKVLGVIGFLIVGIGLLVAIYLVFVKVPELINNVDDDLKKIESEQKYNNYEQDPNFSRT